MAKFLDQETCEVAALELRNAFWDDFSSLCEVYIQATEGLINLDAQEAMMGDLTSIYGRSGNKPSFTLPPVETRDEDNVTSQHETLREALTTTSAVEVYLRGRKICEKRPGLGWYFGG
jgi:hypothetical protein